MAKYYTEDGKQVSAQKYKQYLKQLKEAQTSGADASGPAYYTGQELKALNGQYYDEKGKKITGAEAAQYLAKLKAAETAGTTYAGTKYLTGQELSAMYGGYSPEIIASMPKRNQYLSEAPGQYNVRSDEELQAAAEARYAMTYGMQEAAAANKRDADVLALEQQIAGLEPTYTQRLNSSNRQYAAGSDSLKGAMTSRGLGRSSYASSLLGNQMLARNTAAGNIEAEKTAVEGNLRAQITGAHNAYSSTAEMLAANRGNDMASYLDQLRQQDYQNSLASGAARIDYLNAIRNLPKANQNKKVTTAKATTANTAVSTSKPASTSTSTYEDAMLKARKAVV